MTIDEKQLMEYIRQLVVAEAGPNPFGYLDKSRQPKGSVGWDPQKQQSYAQMQQKEKEQQNPNPGQQGLTMPDMRDSTIMPADTKANTSVPTMSPPQDMNDKTSPGKPGVLVGRQEKLTNVQSMLNSASPEQLEQILSILKGSST